jgi:hypothetical protein
MLEIPQTADRWTVVEIFPYRYSATLILNPFNFVFELPIGFWEPILATVEQAGCRYRRGPEALYILNVPLVEAPELARKIAELAAETLSKSSLWLSEEGEPPALVGYDERPPDARWRKLGD